MLHLFHVHIYLAPISVCVGDAFPPFLIPFPPGLYKHCLLKFERNGYFRPKIEIKS